SPAFNRLCCGTYLRIAPSRVRFREVQSDEFILPWPVVDSFRQDSLYEHPNTSEGKASHSGKGNQDRTQDDDIHQEIREVVFLSDISVLVPGDISVIVHGGEQRLAFIL